MKNLLSGAWWKASAFRALRTALVIAIPYAPTVLYDGSYLIVLSTAAFGALSSLVTSLFGIAETTDSSVPWGWAVAERVIKTAAQATLTLFGTATMFQAVNWQEAPALIGSAVLGSLLIAFMKGIPEAPEPVANAFVSTVVSTETGPSVAEVPVVAVATTTSDTEMHEPGDSGEGRVG